MAQNEKPVQLDLHSPQFQERWVDLEGDVQERAIAAFEKITQLTWNAVYQDKGLRWERIQSIPAPSGVDSLYTFRISKAIRGIAYRDGNFMRVLLIEPDHDAAYGKK